MQQTGPKSIAVVTCSTRPTRIGHLIAAYVTDYLKKASSDPANAALNAEIATIDLADAPLPMMDEPGIPAGYPATDPTSHYAHAHSRKWSTTVRQHDAFIFVCPQYNWGYPASLKNALDYLYHEWAGKPAVVVSYGGRGGNLAGAQLMQVCKGLHMKVIEKTVLVKIRVDEADAAREGGAFVDDRVKAWKADGIDEQLKACSDDLFTMLAEVKKV